MKKLSVVLFALSLSSAALAVTPSEGVSLKVRRGFFTETDVGVFFTVGGDNGYSNLQSYLQLGIGYNFGVSRGGRDILHLGAHFGLGSNAQNCWAGLDNKENCLGVANFTMTFVNASLAYVFELAERLYLGPRINGGYTLLEPAPITGVNGGVNVAVGPTLEYATQMDHFSIGLDALAGMIIGPNILTIQIYPRVKYTF